MLARLLTRRPVRYLIAGGTAFTAEYGAFLLMGWWLHWRPAVAATISFGIGLAVSFTINKAWAFTPTAVRYRFSHHTQAVLYGLIALINIGITNLFVVGAGRLQVAAGLGKLAAMVLIAGWNYLLFKQLVFRAVQ